MKEGQVGCFSLSKIAPIEGNFEHAEVMMERDSNLRSRSRIQRNQITESPIIFKFDRTSYLLLLLLRTLGIDLEHRWIFLS